MFTAVAFKDILKAFDSDNHHILLSKLGCHGVLGTLLLSLQVSYHVVNSKFVWQELSSLWGEVHISVVPWGSILCLLLFNNYMSGVIQNCEI